jgi:hypothetical protein
MRGTIAMHGRWTEDGLVVQPLLERMQQRAREQMP